MLGFHSYGGIVCVNTKFSYSIHQVMDWFHTPVTVSSVGSCDFDRLISFLLVLCPAVEQGRYTSPFYSHQANLRITRSPLLHSRYDNLTIHTTVYRGSFSCILKRIIYNQKKKVFLPVYKRKITFFYSVSWVETSMHFFFCFSPNYLQWTVTKKNIILKIPTFIFFSSRKVLLLLNRMFLAIAIWKLGQVCM